MSGFIMILQVLVCLLMVALILLQPSKGGSFFSASNQGVFGSSGGVNFLFKATMWSAAFLAFSCLALSYIKIKEGKSSVFSETAPVSAPATTAPATPLTTPVEAPIAPPAVPAVPPAPSAPTTAPSK